MVLSQLLCRLLPLCALSPVTVTADGSVRPHIPPPNLNLLNDRDLATPDEWIFSGDGIPRGRMQPPGLTLPRRRVTSSPSLPLHESHHRHMGPVFPTMLVVSSSTTRNFCENTPSISSSEEKYSVVPSGVCLYFPLPPKSGSLSLKHTDRCVAPGRSMRWRLLAYASRFSGNTWCSTSQS